MTAVSFPIKLHTLPKPMHKAITFRGFQGESDYPHILTAINSSKEIDGVTRSDTLEDIVRNYAHLHHSDPYRDMIFAEVGGEVAGYSRCWWDLDAEGKFIGGQIAFVKAEYRHRGIGTRFLQFSEQRLSEILFEAKAKGEVPASTESCFDIFISGTEQEKEALLLKQGFKHVRYFFDMVRHDLENIPDAPLPTGLEVRPVLPEHYRPIWDAANEAFRDHWGYIEAPEEDFQKMLEDPIFDPSLWQVAWDGDQVAGMVQNFVNKAENEEYHRQRGYTEGISVRRPWRKRGLARALIVRSLRMFKELGYKEAALGVDSENLSGALRLYESVGFQVVKRNSMLRKPLP